MGVVQEERSVEPVRREELQCCLLHLIHASHSDLSLSEASHSTLAASHTSHVHPHPPSQLVWLLTDTATRHSPACTRMTDTNRQRVGGDGPWRQAQGVGCQPARGHSRCRQRSPSPSVFIRNITSVTFQCDNRQSRTLTTHQYVKRHTHPLCTCSTTLEHPHNTHRLPHTDSGTNADTDTVTVTDADTDTITDTDTDTDTETNSNTDTRRLKDRGRDIERTRESDRDRETRERDRETETETERQRDRETER